MLPVGSGSLVVGTENEPADPTEVVRRARQHLQLMATRRNANDQQLADHIPITTKRFRVETTGRFSDISPYMGGAGIVNATKTYFCSSGFGLEGGELLTAGHCGAPGNLFKTAPSSDPDHLGGGNNIGNARREHVAHDLLTIGTSVSNRIYDGPIGSGAYSKSVVGWDKTFPGEMICQSGAISGAVCGLRNSDNFSYYYKGKDVYGAEEWYTDLVIADPVEVADRIGSRKGDSGGPVFTIAGSMQVQAKGVVQGACPDGKGNTRLLYQDFETAWRDFGVIPQSNRSVRSIYNNRCIDADWHTNALGAEVRMWDCAYGSSVQDWRGNANGNGEFQIKYNSRCLDADLNTIGRNGTGCSFGIAMVSRSNTGLGQQKACSATRAVADA